jgi:hypothetical protein
LTEQKLLLGIKVSISPTDYYAVQLQLVRFDRTRWMRFGDWSTTGAPMQYRQYGSFTDLAPNFMRTFLAG